MRATWSNFIEAARESREASWRLDCMMEQAAPALAANKGKTYSELVNAVYDLGGFSIPEAAEAVREHLRLQRRG